MGGLGACISPRPGMRQVGFLTRSRSVKNVADAKLEKTSLSADVFQGSSLRILSPLCTSAIIHSLSLKLLHYKLCKVLPLIKILQLRTTFNITLSKKLLYLKTIL